MKPQNRVFFNKKTREKVFAYYKTSTGVSKLVFEKSVNKTTMDNIIEKTRELLNEYELFEKV